MQECTVVQSICKFKGRSIFEGWNTDQFWLRSNLVQRHSVTQGAVSNVAPTAWVARLMEQAPAGRRFYGGHVLPLPGEVRSFVSVCRLGDDVGVLFVAVAFSGARIVLRNWTASWNSILHKLRFAVGKNQGIHNGTSEMTCSREKCIQGKNVFEKRM